MRGLLFHLEDSNKDVWSNPRDIDCWYQIAHSFGFNKIAAIASCGVRCSREPLLELFPSIEEFVKAYPEDKKIVFECPWKGPATPLNDFVFKDGWYCFGPSGGWGEYPKPATLVCVEQKGVDALHAPFIAAIVGRESLF